MAHAAGHSGITANWPDRKPWAYPPAWLYFASFTRAARSARARHLSEGRCSRLECLFWIVPIQIRPRLSGSDGALTKRINGAHSQTTNGELIYERCTDACRFYRL